MGSTHRVGSVIRRNYREVPGVTEEEALFPHPSVRLGFTVPGGLHIDAVVHEWLASVTVRPPWQQECIVLNRHSFSSMH